MNDYQKGWDARTEVEDAWRAYNKPIQGRTMIIIIGLVSAVASFAFFAGAIEAMSWESIPIALLGGILAAPLFLGRWAIRDSERMVAEREHAAAILKKYNIKGF